MDTLSVPHNKPDDLGLLRDWKKEKAMAPHSSTLAWQIPWTEGPGKLQSMGSLRVGHDWATSLSFFSFMHWRRKWQPTPVFLPGESQAAVYRVAQNRTRLKWLSRSRDWKKVEPQEFLSHQHALPFQLDNSAFPMPFLDYGALISPEDPCRIQFPWSLMWPWIIIPLPVQGLIIQPRSSFFFFFFQTLFFPQC